MYIEMKGIEKSFSSNQVVNLTIEPGKVLALMGENGAGKSTLMNIFTGLHDFDAVDIVINGQSTRYKNPKDAEEHGISFIHQELITWPQMTVLENLFMG